MSRRLDRCAACRVMMNRERRRNMERKEALKSLFETVRELNVNFMEAHMLTTTPRARA